MEVKPNFVLKILPVFLLLYGCSVATGGEDHETRLNELMIIISSPDTQEFAMATNELAEMGNEAAPASESLANALSFPRRDSYTAGVALISIGENALSACPGLRIALSDERPEVRLYAAAALGAIRRGAEGAVLGFEPLYQEPLKKSLDWISCQKYMNWILPNQDLYRQMNLMVGFLVKLEDGGWRLGREWNGQIKDIVSLNR
jgi:hypothetical protein